MTLESDPPSTFTPKSRVKRQFTLSVRKMMVVVVCLGCFFGVVTLLSRAIWHAREDARRADCVGHLAQLALALENYRESYGKYPPAYIADKNGKPMHSWRVLILPFIQQQSLYAAVRLSRAVGWTQQHQTSEHDAWNLRLSRAVMVRIRLRRR